MQISYRFSTFATFATFKSGKSGQKPMWNFHGYQILPHRYRIRRIAYYWMVFVILCSWGWLS